MRVEKYNRGARAFHWVLAVLVILNLALGLLHEPLEDVVQLIPLHKSIGLTVLLITLGRIGWRLAWTKPPLPGSVPLFERAMASVTHFLLYVLMLGLPLTGWAFSSAGKYPLTFFDLFAWPRLPVTKDSPLAGLTHEAHEVLGFVMLALVVLHVAAALRHHFLLNDGILRRMW
jgi:cytochrome b561